MEYYDPVNFEVTSDLIGWATSFSKAMVLNLSPHVQCLPV